MLLIVAWFQRSKINTRKDYWLCDSQLPSYRFSEVMFCVHFVSVIWSWCIIAHLKLCVGNPRLRGADGLDDNHLLSFLTDLRYCVNIQTESAFFT